MEPRAGEAVPAPGAKAAILFSAHPWGDTPLGLHHIARALVRLGYAVLFVEPPFSPMHIALGRRRGRKALKQLRPSPQQGVWLFSPFTLLAHQNMPVLKSRFVLENWSRFSWNPLGPALTGTCFATPEIAITGTSIYARHIFDLDAPVKAFRLADDSTLFGAVSPAMRRNARSDFARYDVVFATSRQLAEQARSASARRVVRMPNGVSPEFFSHAIPDAPADLSVLPHPRIVYVGAIEAWFDWPSVVAAAHAMPEASFPIIGAINGAPRNLPPNIHLLGKRRHDAIGAYLAHSDVGLIPFKATGREEALRAINPIKLWEYLGYELPVVASVGLDLPDLPDAIFTYHDPGEFRASLTSALERGKRPLPEGEMISRHWKTIVSRAFADAGIDTA